MGINATGAKPGRAKLTVGLVHGKYLGVKDHKGGNMDEWPADLMVREFPENT